MEVIQEIGIPIELDKGTFVDTEYSNGFLQLKELFLDDDDTPIYTPTGYWESENIHIKDKIRSFKNIVKNLVQKNGSVCKIYTSTSIDGSMWTEYVETDPIEGTIESPMGTYAKIKIELTAALSSVLVTIDDFTQPDKYDNEYVHSDDGSLRLRKEYDYEMSRISEDRIIYSRTVQRSKFKKIDGLNVEISN